MKVSNFESDTNCCSNIDFPVYLYGYASDKEYRKTVPQIRSGEYEGLAEKVSGWRIKLEVLIRLKATTSL